jgi:hypothetical protein
MKKLLMALTLTMLAASSAFAKTSHPGTSVAAADPYTVIAYGEVVGRDPDPNIRFQLIRDAGLLAD